MNDGMYTNIRNYLEEIAGQQKQILAAVQRTNELLEKQGKPTTPYILPAEHIYNPTEGPILYDPATSASMPEAKELKTTTGHVLSSAERAEPTAKPKTAAKKSAKKNDPKPDVSPAVNWNSRNE